MSGFWQIRVRGLVQGVGFRPFVWKLANMAGLKGEVLNDAEGVLIRLQCSQHELEAFQKNLETKPPPLSRIDKIEISPFMETSEWTDFCIIASQQGQITTGIVPDAATCPDCLADIMDPDNRRFGYAFTNCTNCGPRLSITHAIPYDRANTAMAKFWMCRACQAEYDDPSNRRFHAQPNACPDCGPSLTLINEQGDVGGDPIIETVKALNAGKVVAIKGLGGFQLAVDAGNKTAIDILRNRKRRPEKPLACMARDLDMVARYIKLNDTEKRALTGPQAPIVLAEKTGEVLAKNIAPEQSRLGFMLPNTPLHHLLLQHLDRPIILTSGNLSDEPQIMHNDLALTKLSDIADLWLLHDRDIVSRLDDSLVQIIDDVPQILRRARGYAPAPMRLHPGFCNAKPILATGADLKNTFCLLKGGQAIVSQHMGDMENPETQRDFVTNLDLYRRIYDFNPFCIAIDKHPDYFSTRLGQKISIKEGISTISIQHHHAHIAAVLAEHGYGVGTKPVLGIVLDGLGYGEDGTIWGGEFLLANFQSYERLAHFLPVALPGGEKANQQPWRNAVAHLTAAFGADAVSRLAKKYKNIPSLKSLNSKPVPMLTQMIDRGINAPVASSAGRLFDAVAAVLGVCFEAVQFEGQAAMQLQAMAQSCPMERGYYPIKPQRIIKWQTLWECILGDLENKVPTNVIAARFHNSLILVISELSNNIATSKSVDTIVLGGGVMQNSLLISGIKNHLTKSVFTVLCPRIFPANDGSISLGKATIAAALQISDT